jgi:outer membrane murein-binding lipoprotein Lpp
VQIDWNLNAGHLLTAVSALVGVLLTMGRLSQKLDDLRTDVRDLGDEMKAHAQDDARRFEELGKVLYRLSGRIGNGGQ